MLGRVVSGRPGRAQGGRRKCTGGALGTPPTKYSREEVIRRMAAKKKAAKKKGKKVAKKKK